VCEQLGKAELPAVGSDDEWLDWAAEMAGERMKLEVAPREQTGSREARRLRKQGLIPGVLYGRGHAPHAISVPERELRRVLTGGSGMHAILDVLLDGENAPHPSILKDYQQDPLRGKLVHVDLQEVRLDQTITATVTVVLVGAEDAPGVREGGALSQVAREVNVEALPMDVPEHLELDVSGMAMGDTLRIADLRVPEGATLLDDSETVLATLTMPTRVEEPEEVLAEGEEAELEGVPEEERPEGAAEGESRPEAEQGEPGTVEG
jgi:large subunit ribosomal protein L25